MALVPPECATGLAGVHTCTLASLIGVFTRVAQWIFGIAGAAALALFVYGGFVWLTSGGSAERIQKGKTILVQTVIALMVIFGAFTAVQFLVGALRGGGAAATPLVQGERCQKSGRDGTAYAVKGALTCVTDCADLGDEGYSRQDLSGVENPASFDCIRGLFPTEPATIQCCRLITPAP